MTPTTILKYLGTFISASEYYGLKHKNHFLKHWIYFVLIFSKWYFFIARECISALVS